MYKNIVLTTGCFHILHADHIRLFEWCKDYFQESAPIYIMGKEKPWRTKLIVGINSDEYIIKKYGKVKIPLEDRIYMIESCKYVDQVIVFSEEEPSALIERVRPTIFVKGSDYIGKDIPERKILKELKIPIYYSPHDRKYSASEMIKWDQE